MPAFAPEHRTGRGNVFHSHHLILTASASTNEGIMRPATPPQNPPSWIPSSKKATATQEMTKCSTNIPVRIHHLVALGSGGRGEGEGEDWQGVFSGRIFPHHGQKSGSFIVHSRFHPISCGVERIQPDDLHTRHLVGTSHISGSRWGRYTPSQEEQESPVLN